MSRADSTARGGGSLGERRWGPAGPALGLAALVALATVGPVCAEPFDLPVVAQRDCPATVSTKRPDNPGQVRLVPGRGYRAIARNRAEATHYQLRIEGAQPSERWVEAGCVRLGGAAAPLPQAEPPRPTAPGTRSMDGQLVLAASWLPAFCELKGDKPECSTQTAGRPDARRFSLHGLWPQPIGNDFCRVGGRERARAESGDWAGLPALPLDQETRQGLRLRMPGALSHLDRYEWIKHGTCYGTDADTYFDQAMALLDQLNGSAVQVLFEDAIGQRLRTSAIRAAFDRSFGPGAGERVRVECDREGRILELRIGLKGPIEAGARLADLIQAAPQRTAGCRGGWVDRAGPGP